MMRFTTILHPTDFSQPCEFAWQLACSLARVLSARLVVLHVAQPPVVIYDEHGLLLEQPSDYRAAAAQRLATVAACDGSIRVERRLETGEVSSAILRIGKEISADLIVMATHGRTGLDRAVIGSVAEDVLRKAACPVLVAKAPARESVPSVCG